jgi:hypothetical protein
MKDDQNDKSFDSQNTEWLRPFSFDSKEFSDSFKKFFEHLEELKAEIAKQKLIIFFRQEYPDIDIENYFLIDPLNKEKMLFLEECERIKNGKCR